MNLFYFLHSYSAGSPYNTEADCLGRDEPVLGYGCREKLNNDDFEFLRKDDPLYTEIVSLTRRAAWPEVLPPSRSVTQESQCQPAVVPHTFNASAWEAEVDRSLIPD